MPKLILFAPCEKAIVAEGTKVLSLIGLLQELTVQLPAGREFPTDAVVGTQWFIVALWHREANDEGRRFQQRLALTDTSGTVRVESFAEFDLSKPWHRVVTQIGGFPLAAEGEQTLTVGIRERGSENWTQVGAYPLRIKYQQVLTPQVP